MAPSVTGILPCGAPGEGVDPRRGIAGGGPGRGGSARRCASNHLAHPLAGRNSEKRGNAVFMQVNAP